MSAPPASRRPRILVTARDTHPAFRVDITRLFHDGLAADYDFDWLMRDEAGGASRTEPQGRGRVHVMGRGLSAQIRGHLGALARVLAGRYDAVQCRDTFLVAWAYALAARVRGRPFVYWMSYPMEEGYLHRARDSFRRRKFLPGLVRGAIGLAGRASLFGLALPLARHIFVQSEQMKRDITRRRIPAAKITAVPMGVDCDRFTPDSLTPAEDPAYAGRQVVLYTGTLDASRRMEVPAEGVARFCADNPAWVFALIGKSSEAERAAVLAPFEARGLADRVIFQPFMALETMLTHVRRADICLAPYPADIPMLASATPTKLVEYAAMGRRVVANHHPDQDAVARGTGLAEMCDFTAPGFATALARAVRAGAPSAAEQARAGTWVRDRRSYARLTALVAADYAQLLGR